MGGIFVRTDRLEEVGTEIFIDLVKPGWKRQLNLNARITSRVDAIDGRLSKRMPGMGIQFLRLDEKQHGRLQSLLRELGASDEDLEVTLPDELAEYELRALDLDVSGADDEPLDPQPQPLYYQTQMVEAEQRGTSSVEEAIEGALREVDLPAPGPVVLEEDAPRGESGLQESGQDPAADNARLMLQIRGLVLQLAETHAQVRQRDLEIKRLKDELDTIRGALERTVKNR